MELEQEREAADAMDQLYRSPATPYFIPTTSYVNNMPELHLDGFGSEQTIGHQQEHEDKNMTDDINCLIVALQKSMPVKKTRKNRVRVSPFKSSISRKIDNPVQLLPRLRSQTRQRHRRNSVALTYSTKSRRSSVDSDGAFSEPGPDSYDYSKFVSLSGEKVGAYSIEDRKELIKNYLQKRKARVWKKKIKYRVRKTFADSRLRVKGRFISKQDEAKLREALVIVL